MLDWLSWQYLSTCASEDTTLMEEVVNYYLPGTAVRNQVEGEQDLPFA